MPKTQTTNLQATATQERNPRLSNVNLSAAHLYPEWHAYKSWGRIIVRLLIYAHDYTRKQKQLRENSHHRRYTSNDKKIHNPHSNFPFPAIPAASRLTRHGPRATNVWARIMSGQGTVLSGQRATLSGHVYRDGKKKWAKNRTTTRRRVFFRSGFLGKGSKVTIHCETEFKAPSISFLNPRDQDLNPLQFESRKYSTSLRFSD